MTVRTSKHPAEEPNPPKRLKSYEELRETLSERDVEILSDIERFRMLTTTQIRRLHFTTGHQTIAAATRACTRVLQRLAGQKLIAALSRRQGGARRGSDSMTWQLDTRGDGLLRRLSGGEHRRRYVQPSLMFIHHTLAVAELGVQLRETAERGAIELTALAIEGLAHRYFLGRHGERDVLKPDLYAVTASTDDEVQWFIEADRAQEHGPHLLRKLTAYHRYLKSGRYQAEHGLFPYVLWVVPDMARAGHLGRLIDTLKPLPADLFHICTFDAFIDFVVSKTTGIESLPLPGVLDATLHQPPPATEPLT